MAGRITWLMKLITSGSLAIVLQGAALVLGSASTPNCAYGPPPDEDAWNPDPDAPMYDSVSDVQADHGPGQLDVAPEDGVVDWGSVTDLYGTVDYGSQEARTPDVDALDDVVPDVGEPDMALYGPYPLDLSPADTGEDIESEVNCEPMDMYGPPPCGQDSDCTEYGANYYCDLANTVNDSCGDPISWPVCKENNS